MFKEKVNKYQEETKEFLSKWEEKSREFIHNFLENFGNSTNMIKDKVQRAISPRPSRRSFGSDSTLDSEPSSPNSTAPRFGKRGDKRRSSGLSRYSSNEKILDSNGKKLKQSLSDGYEEESDDNFLSSNENNEYYSSDEEEEKEQNVDNGRNGKKNGHGNRKTNNQQQTNSNSKLKTKLKSTLKKYTNSEDVDDELDNQIPLI